MKTNLLLQVKDVIPNEFLVKHSSIIRNYNKGSRIASSAIAIAHYQAVAVEFSYLCLFHYYIWVGLASHQTAWTNKLHSQYKFIGIGKQNSIHLPLENRQMDSRKSNKIKHQMNIRIATCTKVSRNFRTLFVNLFSIEGLQTSKCNERGLMGQNLVKLN